MHTLFDYICTLSGSCIVIATKEYIVSTPSQWLIAETDYNEAFICQQKQECKAHEISTLNTCSYGFMLIQLSSNISEKQMSEKQESNLTFLLCCKFIIWNIF